MDITKNGDVSCCGPGYASPQEAMKAPREKLLYTVALYVGTGIQKPDYLATIDADPDSPTYSQVISRLEMPGIGMNCITRAGMPALRVMVMQAKSGVT